MCIWETNNEKEPRESIPFSSGHFGYTPPFYQNKLCNVVNFSNWIFVCVKPLTYIRLTDVKRLNKKPERFAVQFYGGTFLNFCKLVSSAKRDTNVRKSAPFVFHFNYYWCIVMSDCVWKQNNSVFKKLSW